VNVDVDPDEIDEGARPQRPPGAVTDVLDATTALA